MMSAKEYAEVLKSVLKMQIKYITDHLDYEGNRYLEGQEIGLRIALQKIKESEFLFEGDNNEEN